MNKPEPKHEIVIEIYTAVHTLHIDCGTEDAWSEVQAKMAGYGRITHGGQTNPAIIEFEVSKRYDLVVVALYLAGKSGIVLWLDEVVERTDRAP